MLRIFLLFFSLSLAASSLAADWPEFLGPTRDNHSPEVGLIKKFPAQGPPLLWEKPIGTGYSAPSVRGDLLVFQHRIGDQEMVEACDAKTGESRWIQKSISQFR